MLCLASVLPTIGCAGTNGETERLFVVEQTLGVDASVDYAALLEMGPWDDRNYCLTAADVAYLSPEEEQIKDPIPAFFRAELRKEMPHLRNTGPAQYPRSAVPLFQQRHGGLRQESLAASGSTKDAIDELCDSLDAGKGNARHAKR